VRYRKQARIDWSESRYLVREDRFSNTFNAMRWNLYMILDDGHLVEDGFTHTNGGIEEAIKRLFGRNNEEIDIVSIS